MTAVILIFMPSLIWLLLRQVQSPWWLENILSTPFVLLVIYSILILVLSYFALNLHSFSYCLSYYLSGMLINFILATFLNNAVSINNPLAFKNLFTFKNSVTLNSKTCNDSVIFFQFNIKYTEKEHELNELVAHLIAKQYHLITLQGVSQQTKRRLVEKLSPHFPYFITGENSLQQVYSDQLLFSRYGFANIKYYKKGHSAFLISSQWQLPNNITNLHSLHPPSPRNESLWKIRNTTLYQLKNALKKSRSRAAFVKGEAVNNSLANEALVISSLVNSSLATGSLVIGDLNLSKHSSRLVNLTQGMNTEFVNSWPNKRYVASFFGLAIDHFWVSKPAVICARVRINAFNWSDHYAVKTQVDFKKQIN
ncbi:endonuclease/exonuclease/phosphatase family protein [Colwellia psychrerythraea]|uniref:endonuclease/exonuclease/phosphatase family protein n=1 Tax=Colwellia psychrerythraea TaxID=28229 RepID=UPI0012E0648E|nr:endonuclease/exonuclease/phosphatase family protein [Colwellia psychrerythraea]